MNEITRETNSLKPYLIKFLLSPINKQANIRLTMNGVSNPPKIYKINKKATINRENIIDSSLLKILFKSLFI